MVVLRKGSDGVDHEVERLDPFGPARKRCLEPGTSLRLGITQKTDRYVELVDSFPPNPDAGIRQLALNDEERFLSFSVES